MVMSLKHCQGEELDMGLRYQIEQRHQNLSPYNGRPVNTPHTLPRAQRTYPRGAQRGTQGDQGPKGRKERGEQVKRSLHLVGGTIVLLIC